MASTTNNSSAERPPIVVVMGHVDHGKSTLLDFIRKANTVAGEFGGITQHVAAYEVEHEREGTQKRITFIDTPGHAAFQTIRARGAHIADIAILVVAADDGVKAQTLEALQSIREAEIPFVVAINKIDKPNADLARTQGSLLENHVYLEKLGGDVPWVPISAKQGTGVHELLDLILLVAELHEFKADQTAPAEGFVIESHRDQRRGIAATLIITNGTLSSGEALLAGRAIAPVRIMENHVGKALKSATFSSPITLVGFDDLPEVGSTFRTFKNKRDAEKAREALETVAAAPRHGEHSSENSAYKVPLIVRADTTGTLDAIALEAGRICTERSGINILQLGLGTVTEGDVKAAAANPQNPGLIVGFNVNIDALAKERARQSGIEVEQFNIIYKLTERLEEVLRERTPKQQVEDVLGKAKILKTFSSQKDVQLIGGRVTEGKLEKGEKVRILRRNMEIGVGKVASLQTNKQNVGRVETDMEFGAQIAASFEIAPGDVAECFVTELR